AQADVQADDEVRLHRTAISQVLAFTLQALAVEPPTQKWHDVAHDQLTTWKVEYLDVLREIPETLRKEAPASDYRPSHWKPDRKIHKTRARARARCQPGASTPKHSSTECSGSDQESHSPSAAAASRIRSSRGQGNHTTANQPGKVKGHELAETINRPLGKTDLLRDHTAPWPASAAWPTENHWIRI
ncbi:hypothetical protein ABHI18_006492, partial [Aspergillus niger]